MHFFQSSEDRIGDGLERQKLRDDFDVVVLVELRNGLLLGIPSLLAQIDGDLEGGFLRFTLFDAHTLLFPF